MPKHGKSVDKICFFCRFFRTKMGNVEKGASYCDHWGERFPGQWDDEKAVWKRGCEFWEG